MPDTSFASARTSLAWRRTAALHLATAAASLRLVEDAALGAGLAVVLVFAAVCSAWTGGRVTADAPARGRSIGVLAAVTVAAAVLGILSIGLGPVR